ncbi:MAG: protein phosphatase 2C domain-containing protein [Paludibacteraceae bacterium]|nr:protein phosphatase 2C domain-containing protein [Paludibacteraceae bacterium]
MKYNISVESLVGKKKRYEDHCCFKSYGDDVLVVLADGMGDTDCAKEAAECTVNSIIDNFDTNIPVPDALSKSILFANDVIMNICLERGCKMGCAVAVVYVQDGRIWFVSLGNVRIYIHNANTKECITTDDVYTASNGNRFLTRSISGKDLQGKVEINECSMDGISSISLETDGFYLQDDEDDATVIRIVVV